MVPLPPGRGIERIEPGPGQESVWDYPRPPRLEAESRRVTVSLGGITIIDTRRAYRVLETSHPPTLYLPRRDFVPTALVPAGGSSFCEWKGEATYFDVVAGDRREERAAWTYVTPTAPFAAIAGYVSLYPGRMDAVTLGGVPVQSQEGDFYGGWITPEVLGPFKGAPGTSGW